MNTQRIHINGIPAIVWGRESERVWLCVHGKMSSKEAFEELADLAQQEGWQTISFDLAQHGERTQEKERCDIWNGIRDLTSVADYVFSRWKRVSLFACSLGAYFSLQAYAERNFEKCLFQSPILDMEFLIHQMMRWFEVSAERLEREKEVPTPIDVLSWDYYQYVLAHPVRRWKTPTDILFAGRDQLQSLEIVQAFARRFGCGVTVAKDSDHPFMEANDPAIVRQWLKRHMADLEA